MAKQKMHDFGRLGKWSVSTLRANYNFWDGVVAVEEKYIKERKLADENLDYYGKRKVKGMDIANLSYYLQSYKESNERLDKLEKDYARYEKICKTFERVKKKKK